MTPRHWRHERALRYRRSRLCVEKWFRRIIFTINAAFALAIAAVIAGVRL